MDLYKLQLQIGLLLICSAAVISAPSIIYLGKQNELGHPTHTYMAYL